MTGQATVTHLQPLLKMRDELRHVDAVFAALQQHIHALKGCFAQLQAIINLVLEWTQIYLPAHTESVFVGSNGCSTFMICFSHLPFVAVLC